MSEYTPESVEKTVRQFAADYLERLRWQAGQMIPGADAAIAPEVWHENILERTMEPQEWLTMARYGAGLTDHDAGEIHDICQQMAEWLFAIPGHAAYSIPDEWAETEMGRLWWMAIVRAEGDELITVTQAAEMLGISSNAVTDRISRGTLSAVINPSAKQRQGRRLVRRSDVEDIQAGSNGHG